MPSGTSSPAVRKGRNDRMETQQGLKINKRAFIGTAVMLLVIMAVAGILTLTVPQGQFDRAVIDGQETIVKDTYRQVEGQRLPVWRWLTAPFEVFAGPDASTAILIIVFVLFIGGTFLILESSGVLKYILSGIVARYGSQKYKLLALLSLVCMVLGSMAGLFEETVTLVPITVALALSLGWDSLTGIGMSILSVGFGFAAGTLNPFTIGITQKIAQIPLFSGFAFRAVFFVLIYGLLVVFLIRYAKKVEKDPKSSPVYAIDQAMRERYSGLVSGAQVNSPGVRKASLFFGACLLFVFLWITAGFALPALTDLTMPVMALMFTAGGIGAGLLAGRGAGKVFKDFGSGMLGLLPGAVLVILALSAKQIMAAGGIMDTLLFHAYNAVKQVGPYGAVVLLYAFVLVLELFVAGSTAKAFLVMPLVVPLATLTDLTRQTAVQAFVLGDGFANMVYPTNAVLLITLGLVGIPYLKWLKWTWKLQLAVVVISVAALALAVAIGYGP